MPELLADPANHDARAAAMARHPASAARSGAAVRLEPQVPPPLPFAGVVELLTGLWRVADPEGFAAAMTAAPVVAGHTVLDLSQVSPLERGPVDPRSGALLAALEAAAGHVLGSSDLEFDWVAAIHAGHLYVEARARLARPPGDGREAFVVAHAVEFVGAAGPRPRPAQVGQ
jgi:hypothetical protein